MTWRYRFAQQIVDFYSIHILSEIAKICSALKNDSQIICYFLKQIDSFVFVDSLKECELGWICEEMIEFKWNKRRLFIYGQFAKKFVDTKFSREISI